MYFNVRYNVLYGNGQKRCVITDLCLCRCFVFFFSYSCLWPVGKYGIFGAWGWYKQNKAAAAASALPFQADMCRASQDVDSGTVLLYLHPHLHAVKCVALEAVRMWTSEVKAEMPSSRLVWTQAMFRKAESSIAFWNAFNATYHLHQRNLCSVPSGTTLRYPLCARGSFQKGPCRQGPACLACLKADPSHMSLLETRYESYMHVEHVGCQVGVTFGARVGGALRWGLFLWRSFFFVKRE